MFMEVLPTSCTDLHCPNVTDILDAAKYNQLDQMEKLLTKHNVRTCDEEGISLLMWVSLNGNQQMCKKLLKEGALVDLQDDNGRTALYHAASKGHVELCTLLIENNAHVNQQTNFGWTPLHLAAHNGHARVCTLLLENNAHVDHQANNGWTPLHLAAQKGHVEACALLLEKNTYVGQQENTGATPLFIAAQNGYALVCTLLLEYKAHVNQQKTGSVSPLMAASLHGHVDVCELLLKNNAAVNLKSIYGDNALHLAVVKGKYDVCKLLLKHGAHVDNLNKKGASILDSAYGTRNQKIISLIKKHENNKNVQQEIEKTRKHLKMLQIKRVIDTKKEMLTKIEEMITSLHQLKEFHLEKQREKNNLEVQVDILIQEINERTKRLSGLKAGSTAAETLLKKQKTECEEMVNTMLDQISNISEQIIKYTKDIEALVAGTKIYEQLKQEYQSHYKCFQEGQYDEILMKIGQLSRECPICFSEMLPPIKIFQCSEGHLICQNCFRKISESTQICPFCRRDIVSSPIRNRALEELIENETRRDIRDAKRN